METHSSLDDGLRRVRGGHYLSLTVYEWSVWWNGKLEPGYMLFAKRCPRALTVAILSSIIDGDKDPKAGSTDKVDGFDWF